MIGRQETDGSTSAILGAALRWAGPGARGDLFLEEVERITLTRRDGREQPAHRRNGSGAALRVWNDREIRFAAADGRLDEAPGACLDQLGVPAPDDAPPGRDDPARSPAWNAAGDRALEATARYLNLLEGELSRAVAGARWEISVEETVRRTWVAAETGAPRAHTWRWLRLRIEVRGAAGATALWAGGAADGAGLRRIWPANRLAGSLARRLEGMAAPAGGLPRCGPETAILFAAGNGALVLHEMTHGLEADALLARWSPWGDEGGSVSPLLTVWDDPTRTGLRGSYAHDDEGSPGERELLVRRGRVAGCLGDRLRSEASTAIRPGHGRRAFWQEWPAPRAANLCLAAGCDYRETVQGERGLLLVVHDLEAGGTDPRSGALSLMVSDGEWLDSGRRIGPVSGITLAGNVVDLLSRVDRVCRDRAPDSGAATCSREGVGVPIGFFSPSFRARGLWQIGRRP
jgi:TldD protein